MDLHNTDPEFAERFEYFAFQEVSNEEGRQLPEKSDCKGNTDQPGQYICHRLRILHSGNSKKCLHHKNQRNETQSVS